MTLTLAQALTITITLTLTLILTLNLTKVLLNGVEQDREMMLHAVAKGGEYQHSLGNQDLSFFMQTEVLASLM